MCRIISFSIALALYLSIAQAAPKPQRIVSINLCADQYLLLLAEPNQIAALTYLSHDKSASYYYNQALAYPTSKGLAEDVLQYQPDLVLAGEYAPFATLQLLQKLGVRVETIKIENNLNEVIANVRHIAEWTGQEAKGALVIEAMQQHLATFPPAPVKRPRLVLYEPNGYTVGKATFMGQLMDLAGWQNVAELAGIERYGVLDLESLVMLRPEALLDSPYSENTFSRAEQLTQHPALRAAGINPTIITVPSAETMCAGPWSLNVITTLQQARERMP